MIRKIHLVAAATAAVLCAACDTHIDVPDTASSSRTYPLRGWDSLALRTI